MEVQYTGTKTKLKVSVEALGEHGVIKTSLTDQDATKKRTFEREIGVNKGDTDATQTLVFYAYSSNGNTSKKYTITFTRGESVYATVNIEKELLQSDNCSIEMSWDYGKRKIDVDKECTQDSSLRVAKGAKIKFTVTAGEAHRITKCSSNKHAPITITNPKTEFELIASKDFTLSITFRAESSFKWVKIKGTNSKGYEKVHVSYHLNNEPKQYDYAGEGESEELPMQKGKPCKFWIEGLNTQKYKVLCWKVNSNPVSSSDSSMLLEDDKKSLTIKSTDEKDYEVEIWTCDLYELKIEVCDASENSITDAYSFEVRKGTSNGDVLTQDNGKYVEIEANTQVYITAKEDSSSEYDIEKWQYKGENDPPSSYSDLTGGEITKRTCTITKNTIIRLTLKKKALNVSWIINGADPTINQQSKKTRINAKLNGSPLSSGNNTNVEPGGNIELEVINIEEGRNIKEWKIGGISYTSTAHQGVLVSIDNKKLKINNVRKSYVLSLELEPKKYTVTVEIEKPATKAHSFSISATKNGSPMQATTTTPSYKYENIEHGSVLIFEPNKNEDAYYDSDHWQTKNNGNWQDVMGSEYVMGTKNIKWTIKGNRDLKFLLKKRQFKVYWKTEGGMSEIYVKANASSLTHPPAFVDIESNVEFSVAPDEKYLIKGWKVNNTEYKNDGTTGNIHVSNSKKKLSITNLSSNVNVVLMLEVRKFKVTIEIKKPSLGTEDEANKCTVKATNDKGVLTPDANTKYVFSGVEWGYIYLEAIQNDSRYYVKKWKYKEETGTPHSFIEANYMEPPTKVKWELKEDITFIVVLGYDVEFKIIRDLSLSAKLKIRKDGDTTEYIAGNTTKNVDGHEVDTKVIDVNSQKTKFFLEVTDTTPTRNIVSWKLNGNEKNEFLNEESFWITNTNQYGSPPISGVMFSAGDKVEVMIKRLRRIKFEVVNADGSLYNNGDYKLVIKKNEHNSGYVLPHKDKIEITYDVLQGMTEEGGKKCYSIYITQGASLDFEMIDLPQNKKIVKWKRNWDPAGDNSFNQAFNENSENDKTLITGYIFKFKIDDPEIIVTVTIGDKTP